MADAVHSRARDMLGRLHTFMLDLRDRQRMAVALARGAAALQVRRVDPTLASTWEFSGFSQNGEDGILQFLRERLATSNRYFVEIGAADGLENNTAWLAVVEKYGGLMIEGNPDLVARMNQIVAPQNIGLECRAMFVTRESAPHIARLAAHLDPDVMSLDIDGNDYYVAAALFDAGFRPKIFAVEYNSVFGPDRRVTIPYRESFDFRAAHPSRLYYGVSVAAWRAFFADRGYRFVTVDRNGVNAFFVDPARFDPELLGRVRGIDFAENRYQQRRFGGGHERQFELISALPLVDL